MPGPSGKLSLRTLQRHNPILFRKLVRYAKGKKGTIHDGDWDNLANAVW